MHLNKCVWKGRHLYINKFSVHIIKIHIETIASFLIKMVAHSYERQLLCLLKLSHYIMSVFSFKAILAIKFTLETLFWHVEWNVRYPSVHVRIVLFKKKQRTKGKIQIIVFNVPQKTFRSFYNIHMTFYLTPKLPKQQQQFWFNTNVGKQN